MTNLLQTTGLTKEFGGLTAVSDISIQVRRSEILGIVGPNGAGKSTLFNLISGVEPPTHGRVVFDDKDVIGLGIARVAQMGLVRTFQHSRTFATLSAVDNVLVGGYAFGERGLRPTLSRWLAGANDAARHGDARALLELAGLAGRAETLAGALPYGDQRRLEIARALASRPKLLMLDEPAAGLSRDEIDALTALLRRVRDQGCSVVVIEHHLPMVMALCDRVVVLNHGQVIATGTPEEIRTNQDVVEAYLGKGRKSC